MQKVVITGANRGIGLATAKKFLVEDFIVIAAVRSGAMTVDVNAENLHVVELDLESSKSIKNAAKKICSEFGEIDILINNAGVLYDMEDTEVDIEKLRNTLEVNLLGTIDFTQHLLNCVSDRGSIINVSSYMGSLTVNPAGHEAPAYNISKAALNMFTVHLSDRLKTRKITVSSIHPGWVKTDMGGQEATREPEEAAEDIFKLATSRVESGKFWFKGKKHPW